MEVVKKSVWDILFLSVGICFLSSVVLYICIKKVINPGKKRHGKVLGKSGSKRKNKKTVDVMSSNNSTVSIEISTAEMD
ncbi:hypothetical protein NEAUS04_2028 [Nematocida ausubeli]|uniref:Uncharacterized protein n=1 Tax=Nematocida ausubeli (strain ATCC PRA-371 / ERTm2) TaxID=1913371 RepID=H8ZFD5_NEMA1|nr:uncharacterized protein NESG_01938 [Nematocida ausubeli]EHY64687.1 hypothetical protein NERG_02306 [Nematocida ausubeli]KAI5132682.1 hypothetical protein NEAUS06_0278 [Nematocida ausubeli]KAI5136983.1 hypothetical protein NEAUS07_1740 [Nematocida ausubeli]KAI5146615.1 hypothetical protein NEAUS05_0060 [Nematocida ausubeli]KAI5164208.1 hypothetical protein NEAUS04_2028 [Nematocida ausubeli]